MTAAAHAARAWPGRGRRADDVAWGRPRAAERFTDYGFVVLVAAAERYGVPERWGLGVALGGSGSAISTAQLVVADDLSARDREALAALELWARTTTVPGPLGALSVEVVTRSAFLHPADGLWSGTYWRGRWGVTGDGGRSLGLIADHWAPGRGRFSGGWSLGLAGWGAVGTWTDAAGRERHGWRPMLHQPALRVAPIADHGLAVEYARAGRGGRTPDGQPAGHWERGRPFLGRFLDVAAVANALDGEDTGVLGDHLAAFGLPLADVPAAVPVDPSGAAALFDAAFAVHALALRLDLEVGRWLATREDRRDGIARVAVARLASPGTLARSILDRTGLTPPLAKFAVPDDMALDRWSGHQHGGWATADLRGQIVPALDADVRSAYPAAWSLLGCFDLLRSARLVEVDARAEVLDLLRSCAAGDIAPLLDPATYRQLGLTRVQVMPDGETWPVQLDAVSGRSGRLRVGPARSADGATVWVSWPWAAVAALLSGRVPTIRRALRLARDGDEVEPGRPVPIFDDLVVGAGDDPVPALVRLRTEAKRRIAAGVAEPDDERLAVLLRVVVNALAYGGFARLDDGGGELRPARWTWPPIAATVPACAALWLAMAQRWAEDRGGGVVNRDTDGVVLAASPDGGKLDLADGRVVSVLPYDDVAGWLRGFDALDPFGDGGQFWSVNTGESGAPLHVLVLARKRYVELLPDGAGGFTPVDHTEHAIGGNVAEPPGSRGRDAGGRLAWTAPGARRAVDAAMGADVSIWRPTWDGDDEQPWPDIRRLTAVSRDALLPRRRREGRRRVTVPAAVPAALGARPFTPYLKASLDPLAVPPIADAGAPVALDPGTDLREWRSLCWVEPRSGAAVSATTDDEPGAFILMPLARRLRAWSLVAPADDDGGVIDLVPELRRRLGPWSGLVSAQLADDGVDPADFLTVASEGDPARWVAGEARRLGPRVFARRFGVALGTAKRLASGERRPHPATVACVLRVLADGERPPALCQREGCGRPVRRSGAAFCSDACREWRRRQVTRGPAPDPGVCAMPGCSAPARPRSSTCCERHRVALRRLRVAGEGAGA